MVKHLDSKLYKIQRVFYNSKQEQIRVYDHGLEPMNHKDACIVLPKLSIHQERKQYNFIDRLVEV